MKTTHIAWSKAARMAVAVTALSCTAGVSAQLDSKAAGSSRADEPVLNMVATSKLTSMLTVDGKKQAVSGRLSVHLSATEQQLEDGVVTVGGFNVVYMDADQQLLAGRKVAGPERGLLAFAARNEGVAQELDYDRTKGRIRGELFGTVDTDFMASMVAPLNDIKSDLKGEGDNFETATQTATLYVDMKLEDSLPGRGQQSRKGNEVQRRLASANFELEVNEDVRSGLDNRYKLQAVKVPVDFQVTWWFEVAQNLCVQPVRIGRISFTGGRWPFGSPTLSVDYTGAGLAFGLPGARREWAKADVTLSVRGWRTVFNQNYFVMDTNGNSTSTEEAALRAEVTDADCIEVFFVENNDPVSAHGGGATWGSGTATSQIITSDGNAVGGIDFTHLAHELGHVLDLPHPTGAAGVSTGSLMCPSGWLNDNPAVNSQENKDNASNPLLTFTIKFASPGPDCANSADCGAC